MTNSENIVDTFKIIDKTIGVSPQSCHRILKVSINLKVGESEVIDPDHVNFNSIGAMKKLYFEHISASCEKLQKIDYCALQQIYLNAKKEILGTFIVRGKYRNLSPERSTRKIQKSSGRNAFS